MDRLVALAVHRRYLMVGLFVAVLIGGLVAFKQLNIEAYPDPTPPMVDIVTQSPGLSSEEIERYITIPIETQVAGIKNLRTIRTISLYGLSDVKLQFSFDYTYDEALQQVLNRLSQMPPLPGNVQPGISPLSAIGEIYRYRLVGPPNYSVLDLKTLQDWVLQRRFRAVPGVIDVTGWGGRTKTYELQVDFNKLIANGLTLPQLLQAVGNSNINVGGSTVNIGAQSAVVRGVGLIRSIDDLANTMVSQSGGNPVLVKDIATVTVGEKPRLGIAGLDQDDDIVQGIVLMRRGEQSSPTIARVEQLVNVDQQLQHPAAGGKNRAHLRPQGPDRHHYPYGAAQYGGRHPADRAAAMDFPRRPPKRADRRRHHSVRAVFRRHHPGAARRIRQFAVGRRDRLRADRGRHRDHGGGDLPPAVANHRTVGSRAEPHLARNRHGHEEPCHPLGRGRRVALDLLCRGHHHRGIHSAVHLERRRRQYFRADGADIRLCAGRRPARDLHGDARAERADPAVAHGGNRNPDHGVPASHLHAGADLGGRQSKACDGGGRGPRGPDHRFRPAARP